MAPSAIAGDNRCLNDERSTHVSREHFENLVEARKVVGAIGSGDNDLRSAWRALEEPEQRLRAPDVAC